jgi:hypothetical protein
MNIETIRKAVIKNRGGFEMATDGEIMTLWQSLDEATREKYIESTKTEKSKSTSAVSSKREN